MSDLSLVFDKQSPSELSEEIKIKVVSEKNNLQYKFLEGSPGKTNLTWKPIQDFSYKNECKWKPKKSGDYMIMVQYKPKKSKTAKNIKVTYEIKPIEEKNIIENVIKDIAIEDSVVKEAVVEDSIIQSDIELQNSNVDEDSTLKSFELEPTRLESSISEHISNEKLNEIFKSDIELNNDDSKVSNSIEEVCDIKEELVETLELNSVEELKEDSTVCATLTEEVIVKENDLEIKEIESEILEIKDTLIENMLKDEVLEPKNESIIKEVKVDNTSVVLGERFNIEVIPVDDKEPMLYRFWIGGFRGWDPIKDYAPENTLTYTTTKLGEIEILIECKKASSMNNVDSFATVLINVKEQPKIEITSFECLTENLLVNEELVFKVGADKDPTRTVLYKFLKVDSNGRTFCIQDYSSKNVVSFEEKKKGEYKLLCHVRDMMSNNPYDDRAMISYDIKQYQDIKIDSFTQDLISPQVAGTTITFKSSVTGGYDLEYRYIVEGPLAEDTGYINLKNFNWYADVEGEYNITLMVRDKSYKGEYEDKRSVSFNIDKKADKPVKILNIASSKTSRCVKGDSINIKVKAEGGTDLKYAFIVYKDGVEKEKTDYGITNWTNFTAYESGEYQVEIRVVDKYSRKEFDCHNFMNFRVKDYEESEIDYVILSQKDMYLVGDTIQLEAIMENTTNTLVRYVTKINGQEVEDTDFVLNKRLKVSPRCAGKYTFEMYARNVLCKEGYDSKKEVSVYVHDAIPITNTRIKMSNEFVRVGQEVTFEVKNDGGKETCYEFYVMQKGNWLKVQAYSRKNYYTLLPFTAGNCRILVLSKSYYKNINYEDYATLEFEVRD